MSKSIYFIVIIILLLFATLEKEVLAVYRLPPALFENEKEGKKLLEKALPGSKCLAVFKKESTWYVSSMYLGAIIFISWAILLTHTFTVYK